LNLCVANDPVIESRHLYPCWLTQSAFPPTGQPLRQHGKDRADEEAGLSSLEESYRIEGSQRFKDVIRCEKEIKIVIARALTQWTTSRSACTHPLSPFG
jgi:hypothetical protein